MSLASRIRQRRQELNLTQTELAEKAGSVSNQSNPLKMVEPKNQEIL